MITCPYDEITLRVSLLSGSMKIGRLSEDALAVLEKETDAIFKPNNSSTLQEVANFHKISVEALLGSPNYESLKDEYMASTLMSFIALLKQNGLSDKEAWGVVMAQKLGADI